MSHPFTAPRFEDKGQPIVELCQLYRAIDVIEETAHMAHQTLSYQVKGSSTPATKYLDTLQEYLGSERVSIVDALRNRPHSDDDDGNRRLSVILQFEAWCQEFNGSTVDDFNASSLSKDASR